MKDTPTRGPISASMTHHDRELISSRHSFLRSHFHALLCEGKEDLLKIRRQVMAGALARQRNEHGKRALGDDAAAAQEDEAVADLRGIADLVNGKKERAIAVKMPAQRGGGVPALAQVETLERFVDQEYRLGREQPESKQNSFALSIGQGADRELYKLSQRKVG